MTVADKMPSDNIEQQTLVNLIFSNDHALSFDPRGIEIYRRNLRANATRALQITYPTVALLIGDALFEFASEQLLLNDPLDRGDWGEWGENFPTVLSQLEALNDFPYVVDCAKLDLACHKAERSIDYQLNTNSFQLLEDADLDDIYIHVYPAVSVVTSSYPILDIFYSQHDKTKPQYYFEQAKQKISENIPQSALVFRTEYKAQTLALKTNDADMQWLELMMQNITIGDALKRLNSSQFSLETWLPFSIENKLITGFSLEARPSLL